MSEEKQEKQEIQEGHEAIGLAEFLESTPPSSLTEISDLVEANYYQNGEFSGAYLTRPEIQLHCPDDSCNGTRFFRCTTKKQISVSEEFSFEYISYICSNCRKTEKTFSLAVKRSGLDGAGSSYKFGELPLYGPPTPSKLIKLIGPDRDIFLKGRRCENQGLGIGAFVYYRRVVENQKNRILDEIIKVSEKLSAPAASIETLQQAKNETQFSKALSSVKDALPQALLINGHNPLSLLHSALSEGLHNQTDEYCLEIASSVRVVLGELSDRLGQALKDEAELNHALSKLLQGNSANNASKGAQ
ncbi:hypothetical protein CXF80_18125 [Shewanella sp. Actino-trap-3]|uniref:hypothetical protein n=1 Tax=Shewanella sp. Actino-trap-3 TaxID=2058331 RepID=UPI000C349A14|nr:hypothetical protein [Shewanella sp. Actino-trap-3]PKG80060.1 hypothetical protein CXF80_18125 [Shewanella sp. Actino-trap-3]